MSAFAESTVAWEPVTPRGVAAFARAPLGRLLLVQSIVAALATASILWLLYDGCFPTVHAAIEAARHRRNPCRPARLARPTRRNFWPKALSRLHRGLGSRRRDPIAGGLQIEFGRDSVRVFSLFGEAEWLIRPTDIPSTVPTWSRSGARGSRIGWPPVLAVVLGPAAVVGGAGHGLLPAGVAALFFHNRDLNFRESWRLSGAALMPGALLLARDGALRLGRFDLVQFCFAFGTHLALGWIYLFLSPLFLPRLGSASPKGNPFALR